MRRFLRYLCVAAVIPVLVGTLTPSLAEPATMDLPQPNIRLTVRVGHDGDDAGKRSYTVVVSGGRNTTFVMGERIPIAVTTFQTSTSNVPITSYTYQNVGFTAKMHAWIESDGKIRLDASLEDSYLINDRPQPTIGALQQRFDVRLVADVPLRVGRVDDGASSGYFEIEASLIE